MNQNSVPNKNQVIITTHSSEFIRNTDIWNIITVRKLEGKTITKRINIDKSQNKELAKLQNIISTKNAEIFFSDKVILVEGAEEYLIPLIADYIYGEKGYLDNHNISVAKVGGKTFFKQYMELLSYLDIEYVVIADFDILYNGLESLGDFIYNFSQAELNEIKKDLQEILINDDPWIKSKDIKRRLLVPDKSFDAKSFCTLIDEICTSENYSDKIESLKEMWKYLKPKVIKRVNCNIFSDDKLLNFINRIRNDKIYILKRGELEDYITSDGQKFIKELEMENQKELKIIKLVELINDNKINLQQVLDIDEYSEAIKALN